MKAQAGDAQQHFFVRVKHPAKGLLMLQVQSFWFGQFLLGHYYKGWELEIHSYPDDPPGNLPKRAIHRFENKQAEVGLGRKVSRS